MGVRRFLPALAVALAAAAALGPPVAAAPGEGGGATSGGGVAYGQDVPKPKPKSKAKRHRAKLTSSGPHRFPIAGLFDWGDADSRFGAGRKGHRHQGQDLPAAAGTPVVAPYRGVVTEVEYQARGAGHYVVVHSTDYDYVFMHLRSGSTVVREGQSVRTGQRIADVGSTGESTGPHLHFEVWVGTWYAGGHPVDPLPLLQAWASPASG